jgi:hypothetical protein
MKLTIILYILIGLPNQEVTSEQKIGPIHFNIPANYLVDVNDDDTFVASFLKNKLGNFGHFNIQLAKIADIVSGKIQAFEELSKFRNDSIQDSITISDLTNTIMPDGKKVEAFSGTQLIEEKVANFYVAQITGKKYIVYFAIFDTRSNETFNKIINEISKSILSIDI